MATRKPCPGCGEVKRHRPAREVCSECKRLMVDGKAFRVFAVSSKAHELAAITSLPYQYPYIRRGNHEGSESNRKFSDAFAALVLHLSEKNLKIDYDYRQQVQPVVPRYDTSDEIHRQNEVVMLPKGCTALLGKLYHAAIALAHDAYAQGHDDGGQLLTRLAKGEISVDDFNRSARQAGSLERDTDRDVIAMMNDPKLPKKVRDAASKLYHFHRHQR